MKKFRVKGRGVVLCLAALGAVAMLGASIYATSRGTTSSYELEQDQVSTVSTTNSDSGSYTMTDTVQALGVEGGIQESASYSITSTAPETEEAESASVAEWQEFDK